MVIMSNLRRSLFPLMFTLIQCSSVNAYYGTCTDYNCDSPGSNFGLAIGLAFGIFALVVVLSLVFVCVRRNRIRNFQQTYVQNAQAQALAAQQVQQNYQAQLNAQYSSYPQPLDATAQGWQPAPPAPVHHQVHHQVYHQPQMPPN
ncbi:hypothetical protein EDD18DRAFT_1124343 [Armillaria luteobubalina]|uniref:Uncharacterized protein n=1 Tax=Armillaria luteobubalina TaxID=153913 RepID=A0AA39QPC0_9AGAR|nr:hypothetical protein EDD18DRAFT_1124343 [Armillaria luteobubalina]